MFTLFFFWSLTLSLSFFFDRTVEPLEKNYFSYVYCQQKESATRTAVLFIILINILSTYDLWQIEPGKEKCSLIYFCLLIIFIFTFILSEIIWRDLQEIHQWVFFNWTRLRFMSRVFFFFYYWE